MAPSIFSREQFKLVQTDSAGNYQTYAGTGLNVTNNTAGSISGNLQIYAAYNSAGGSGPPSPVAEFGYDGTSSFMDSTGNALRITGDNTERRTSTTRCGRPRLGWTGPVMSKWSAFY